MSVESALAEGATVTLASRPAAEPPQAAEPAAIGSVIGRYVVLDTLGSGGMGTVLRAYDPRLHREVALKRLHSLAFGPESASRLVREAQALAQLSHPNVVAVYDVESDSDDVIVAMELVRGMTLSRWLKKPRRWREVVEVMLAAGRGLSAAHDANLVHRDFKPANVMISEQGQVKVMDFGLAKVSLSEEPSESDLALVRARARLPPTAELQTPGVTTRADVVMGTPPYMAPEQHAGTALDPAVDQYAFCVTLWYALVGQRPFSGTVRELTEAKALGPPPWPRRVAVPRRLIEAVRRGLAPQPADRWLDMDALLEQLVLALRPRHRRWRSLAVAAMLGGGAVSAALLQADRRSRCEGGREQLDGIWDDATRTEIQQRIDAVGAELAATVRDRVSERLDAYTEAWVAGHREACEATTRAEQSSTVLDLRMACLHRSRRVLRANVGLLRTLDERTVLRATELVERLPDLERCADVDALLAEVPPPEDPAVRAAVDEADERLAEASSLHQLGRYDQALEGVRLLEADVASLDHGPLMAEIAAQEGLTLEALGRFEQARLALRRAVGLAFEHGSLSVAVHAISTWAFVLSERLSRLDEALLVAELGLRLARRVGGTSLEALALNRKASVLHVQGQWVESEAGYRDALRLLEGAEPLDELLVATVSNDLGALLNERGRVAESLALHRRALEIRERRLGSNHPHVGSSLTNLGNDHYEQGDHDQAQRSIERALAIYERVYGDDHPLTTLTRGNLGALLLMRGDLDRAAALMEQVARVNEQIYGLAHPETASIYNNLARLEQERGNVDQTREYLERSLEILIAAVGPDHPQLRTSYQNLGLLELEQGHHDRARAHFERALAVFPDAPPEQLGSTKFELAQLLWDEPGSAARARTLAQEAAQAYRDAEGEQEPLAQVEAWLAAHVLDSAASSRSARDRATARRRSPAR